MATTTGLFTTWLIDWLQITTIDHTTNWLQADRWLWVDYKLTINNYRLTTNTFKWLLKKMATGWLLLQVCLLYWSWLTTNKLATTWNWPQADYKLTTSWDYKLITAGWLTTIDKLSYKLIAEWTTNKLTATQPRPRTLTHLTNLAGITSLYLPNLPSDLAYLIICLSPILNYNWLQLTNQDRLATKIEWLQIEGLGVASYDNDYLTLTPMKA
jgi:hypothetical protein